MKNQEITQIVSDLGQSAGSEKVLSRLVLFNHERLMNLEIDDFEMVLDLLIKDGIRIVDKCNKDNSEKSIQSVGDETLSSTMRRRKPKTTLLVKFSDGKTFQGAVASVVFVEAIAHMGVEKVRQLGFFCCDTPLVSEKTTRKYSASQKFCDGYYIFTYNSTEKKKELLEKIASLLRVGIDVEVVTRDAFRSQESEHFKKEKRTITVSEKDLKNKQKEKAMDVEQENQVNCNFFQKKPKTNLKVTLPDGTVLKNRKAWVTFVAAISFLGVEKVRDLGLIFSKTPLVSIKTTPRYASSQKFCDGFYIFTYNSTEKKKEILERIAAKLDQEIIVKVVNDHIRGLSERKLDI